MAIDAGSVQASLNLDVSNFGAGIASARAQLQAFSEAAGAIDGSLSELQQTMTNAYNLISQSAAVAAKTMTEENAKAAGQMKTALSEMTASTEQLLATFQNNVTAKMNTATGNMVIAGSNMGDGLVAGILSRLTAASSAGAALARAAEQGAKTAAQIHSPSRVFMEIGRYLDEGLAQGIRENKYLANNEMAAVANAILQTGNEISTGLISFDRATGSVLIDSAYEALMTKTELYLTERDQRIMHVTEGTEESIRQIERETRATEDAYDIKIKLYEQEMYAKLSLIDDVSNEQIADLRKQLNDINKLNESDRKNEAGERYKEQLSAKEKALLTAKTAEEAQRILEQIATLKRNREKVLLQEARKEQQDAIRNEILEIQEKTKADKDALREEFEAKKYQLQQKQEAETAYLQEMQKRLSEDSKIRKELEDVQTKIKQAENKKRSQAEVAELKVREQELLLSLANNKTSLAAFTATVESIGKGYGEKMLSGFRSTESQIVDYLHWIAGQAEKAGRAVAEAKEGEWESAQDLRRTFVVDEEPTSMLRQGEGTGFAKARSGMLLGMNMASFHSSQVVSAYEIEQKQKTIELTIDYNKLSEAIAKSIPTGINMENHFSSPRALSEAEIRKNQELLLRDLAFRF